MILGSLRIESATLPQPQKRHSTDVATVLIVEQGEREVVAALASFDMKCTFKIFCWQPGRWLPHFFPWITSVAEYEIIHINHNTVCRVFCPSFLAGIIFNFSSSRI